MDVPASIQQVATLIAAGQQLVAVGVATVDQIRTFYKTLHPGMTDADLNAICDAIEAGAIRHKGLADADLTAGQQNS